MFCQKYMAAEITKLQHYSEGRVKDSLVEIFHKMDLMLADQQYSQASHLPEHADQGFYVRGPASHPAFSAAPSTAHPAPAHAVCIIRVDVQELLQLRGGKRNGPPPAQGSSQGESSGESQVRVHTPCAATTSLLGRIIIGSCAALAA